MAAPSSFDEQPVPTATADDLSRESLDLFFATNSLSKMKGRRAGLAFLESRGEGVRRILEASEAHAGRRPVYQLFGQELRLTIWAKPSPHEERAD